MTILSQYVDGSPMEGPKEDPDDIGEQGDDVCHRADLADGHIHWCCKQLKSSNIKLVSKPIALHISHIAHCFKTHCNAHWKRAVDCQ